MFYLSRLVLRCRQLARERFAQMRSDVLVKLELLDQKHGWFLFFKLIFIYLFPISSRYGFSITSFYYCS